MPILTPIWEAAAIRGGGVVEFDVENQMAGGMKHVYFAKGGTEVVAFFHNSDPDPNREERLKNVITDFNPTLPSVMHHEYWESLFCWPTAIVDHPRFGIGIKLPKYPSNFIFQAGNYKGKEKEGCWFNSFNSQKNKLYRYTHVDESERGNLRTYLAALTKVCRAVSRMHMAGLAHADLSERNVLIDPSTGGAIVIDLDALVVTGMYPPDVAGTPGYIAPEVLATIHLSFGNILKKSPCAETDRYALAVMIYKYLLERHPLEGQRKVLGLTAEEEDIKIFGAGAIYSEHRNNHTNRPVDSKYLKASILGKELEDLFHKCFVDGLLDPAKRPLPFEFEMALCAAFDILLPCRNPVCTHKYFVLTNKTKPICPYCKTKFGGRYSILKLSHEDKGQITNGGEMVLHGTEIEGQGTNIFRFHAFKNAKRGAGQDNTLLATVVYLTAPNPNPGYYLKNIGVPDMQVRNPSAGNQNFQQVPLTRHVLLNNGTEILFGNSANARKGSIETISIP